MLMNTRCRVISADEVLAGVTDRTGRHDNGFHHQDLRVEGVGAECGRIGGVCPVARSRSCRRQRSLSLLLATAACRRAQDLFLGAFTVLADWTLVEPVRLHITGSGNSRLRATRSMIGTSVSSPLIRLNACPRVWYGFFPALPRLVHCIGVSETTGATMRPIVSLFSLMPATALAVRPRRPASSLDRIHHTPNPPVTTTTSVWCSRPMVCRPCLMCSQRAYRRGFVAKRRPIPTRASPTTRRRHG